MADSSNKRADDGDKPRGGGRGGRRGGRGGGRGGRGGGRGGRGGAAGGRGGLDDTADRAAIDTMYRKIDTLNDELKALQIELTKRNDKKNGLDKERNTLRQRLRELSTRRNELFGKKKPIRAKINQIADGRKAKLAALWEVKKDLPYKKDKEPDFVEKNRAEFENRIKAIEDQIAAGVKTLKEEKDLVRKAEEVRRSMKVVDDYEAALAKVENNKPELDKLYASLKEDDAEIDTIKAEEDKLAPRMKEVIEQLKTAKPDADATFAKIKSKRQQISATYKDIKKSKAELDAKWKEYKQKQDELRKKRIEDRKRSEKQRAESEKAAQDEFETHVAESLPFEDEVDTCTQLIKYLKPIARRRGGKKKNLVHTIQKYAAFEQISMVPPSLIDQVDDCIKQVEDKKEAYLKQQVEAVEEREAKAKAAAEKKAKAAAEAEAKAAAGETAAEEEEKKEEEGDEATSAPAEEEEKKEEAVEEETTASEATEEDAAAPAADEETKAAPAEEEKEEAKEAEAEAEAEDDDDDDDVDLFGSDDENDGAHEAYIQQVADAHIKKRAEEREAKGKVVIARSVVVLDVKPWEAETDMEELEKLVRGVEMEGLEWKASELLDMAFGVKKLRITAHVVDDLVSTDTLEEAITEFEDHVQSVDVDSFSKL